MDDLEVFIQIKQWNCTLLQIQKKVLATKSKKNSDNTPEALHEASSKKSISVAKAKHKICAIVDEYEALSKMRHPLNLSVICPIMKSFD